MEDFRKPEVHLGKQISDNENLTSRSGNAKNKRK